MDKDCKELQSVFRGDMLTAQKSRSKNLEKVLKKTIMSDPSREFLYVGFILSYVK